MRWDWWRRQLLLEFPGKINYFPEPQCFTIWSDRHCMSLLPVLPHKICVQYLIESQNNYVLTGSQRNSKINWINTCYCKFWNRSRVSRPGQRWLKQCAHHRKGLWEDIAFTNKSGEEDLVDTRSTECPDVVGVGGILVTFSYVLVKICLANNTWLGGIGCRLISNIISLGAFK